MVDSKPYPSDREDRPPRKHRHDQRSSRTETQERSSDYHSGPERRNHEERHRDRYHDDRSPRRPREDVGSGHHHERERPREDRGQHRERGRDGHRDRDQRHEDRGHSRTDRSQHYKDRGDERSEESQHCEQQDDYYKERNHARFDDGDRDSERYMHSSRGKIPEYYNPSERSFPHNGAQMDDMEYYEEPQGGILDCHQCKYLCTGRACCQLVEVLLNMLILICCSVSYNSTGGFTGITNMGGIYYYQFGGAYSGFSGADGEKAQTLDVQFYNLKLPTVTVSMAFGGSLMAFCCLLVLLGVLRVPWRWPLWLLVECVLDVAIAIGYIPALYFYFQRLQEAYSSQVCKDREALYSSKGYQGFSCALHGADIGAALFACMAIIAFFLSAFLAIQGFRTVRRLKKKPTNALEF